MESGWDQTLDRIGRVTAPTALAVLLLLLASASAPIFSSDLPSVNVALLSILFWSLHRPDAMPAGCAFGLGLLEDLLTGGLLGLNAVTLLLAHLAIVGQSRLLMAQSFLGVWAAVAGVAFAAEALRLILHILLADGGPAIAEAIMRALAAAAVYPVFAFVMGRIDHRLFGSEPA